MNTTGKKKYKVVFTTKQFAEKGFDGEIASYMRNNKQAAICNQDEGRCVIEFLNKLKSK